ncbi:hypothetical protein Sru01_40980 [Sphaerisporangium rufum]|uniref:Aspartyl/asparaginy/proline hydroxylase domain-containing protein n=1 Tax=Sphaerisporangium rufum TaxID=1381558 RepID=A0A919R3N7_9ACTN|nr:aspartyl/asparaginyl beta-hydroxylase domain-containing protein [Sphaerisporangium rufum]GII79116.1 hypothetical protein Sru01_40980 [Sphaerisporangium rufum]
MTTSLLRQVACAGAVDHALLEHVRHEALTVPSGWMAEYGEYQSGGWETLSLLNRTGRATDVTITDCEPTETDLLAAMPATRQLLADLGLHFMWARIARLDAAAYLWEHRDYGELKDVERHRLHIPIVTSSSAYLVLSGSAVHLAAGHIWRLTPTYAHGACNRFGPARVHLILDCYASPELAVLTRDQYLPAGSVRPLPPLTDALLRHHAAQALRLAQLGYAKAAEEHLLRLFFDHTLPEGRAYDLIADMYDAIGHDDAADGWREKKAVLLGIN